MASLVALDRARFRAEAPCIADDVAPRLDAQIAALVRIPRLIAGEGRVVGPGGLGRTKQQGVLRLRRTRRVEARIAAITQMGGRTCGVDTEAGFHAHVLRRQQRQVSLAGTQHAPGRRAQALAVGSDFGKRAAAVAITGDCTDIFLGHAHLGAKFRRRPADPGLVPPPHQRTLLVHQARRRAAERSQFTDVTFGDTQHFSRLPGRLADQTVVPPPEQRTFQVDDTIAFPFRRGGHCTDGAVVAVGEHDAAVTAPATRARIGRRCICTSHRSQVP